MANKQQTAVEWLKSNLPSLFIDDSGHYQELFKHAIQMEREQIETAYIVGIIHPLEMEASKQAKQYFNDTYGTEPSR